MRNLKNRVNLIGNLGMDPEIKKLENGSSLARFSLATSDSYKNKDGEKIKETQWHNLVAWGNTAQFAEKYLKKGQEIAVEGKLTHRTYEKGEGEKQYITEVVVNEIQMLRSTNNA